MKKTFALLVILSLFGCTQQTPEQRQKYQESISKYQVVCRENGNVVYDKLSTAAYPDHGFLVVHLPNANKEYVSGNCIVEVR